MSPLWQEQKFLKPQDHILCMYPLLLKVWRHQHHYLTLRFPLKASPVPTEGPPLRVRTSDLSETTFYHVFSHFVLTHTSLEFYVPTPFFNLFVLSGPGDHRMPCRTPPLSTEHPPSSRNLQTKPSTWLFFHHYVRPARLRSYLTTLTRSQSDRIVNSLESSPVVPWQPPPPLAT